MIITYVRYNSQIKNKNKNNQGFMFHSDAPEDSPLPFLVL